MKLRYVWILFLACFIFVQCISVKPSYSQSSTTVSEPNFTILPITLTTACSTPLTPASCASTSYSIISMNGVGDISLQIPAINGNTVSWYKSNDRVNFTPVNMSTGNTNGVVTVAQSTSTAGNFVFNGSGAAYLEVAVTTLGSSSVTIIPNLSQHIGAVSIHGSVPLQITNPAPIPTPVVSTVALQTLGSNYTYTLSNYGYTQLSCDVSGMDGTAYLSASLAFDGANAHQYGTSGVWLQGPAYGQSFSQNGQYIFAVQGAQFFNLSVSTTGATQNASITCNPRFTNGLPVSLDASGNQKVTIAGASIPVPVTTPNPAPTVVNGEIAVSNACSQSPVTANGVIQCHADASGNQDVNCVVGCSASSPGPTSSPGHVPLDVPANASAVPYSSTNPLPVSNAFPYSLTSNAQTAQTASGVGVLGVYSSTPPTLTNGQASPIQLGQYGSVQTAICTNSGYQCASVNAVYNDNSPFTNALSTTGIPTLYNGTAYDKARTVAGITGSAAPTGLLATGICNGASATANCAYVGATGSNLGSPNSAYVNAAVRGLNYAGGTGNIGSDYQTDSNPLVLWTTSGGRATASLPAAAGNVVIKSSPGRLVKALVTTTGTAGNVLCYDNATTNSGTIIGVVPAASTAGTVIDFSMPATNGITCVSSTTSPALTLSYY